MGKTTVKTVKENIEIKDGISLEEWKLEMMDIITDQGSIPKKITYYREYGDVEITNEEVE